MGVFGKAFTEGELEIEPKTFENGGLQGVRRGFLGGLGSSNGPSWIKFGPGGRLGLRWPI